MDLTLIEQKAQNLAYQWFDNLTEDAQNTVSSHDMEALWHMIALFGQDHNNPIFTLPEPLDPNNN